MLTPHLGNLPYSAGWTPSPQENGRTPVLAPRHHGSRRRAPGRFRQGWVLHIILDTSGSMVDILPRALGAIAIFCEASNVSDVRLVQCDQVVTSDRWIEPEQLAEFEISGFGYSDMSPAILHLAADPEVESVLVLTDGYIDYPKEPPSSRVLWASLAITSCPSSPPMGR